MRATTESGNGKAGPKRPKPHDHNVNEPAHLIEEEPAGIERGVPAEPNEPVERPERQDTSEPPVFEE